MRSKETREDTGRDGDSEEPSREGRRAGALVRSSPPPLSLTRSKAPLGLAAQSLRLMVLLVWYPGMGLSYARASTCTHGQGEGEGERGGAGRGCSRGRWCVWPSITQGYGHLTLLLVVSSPHSLNNVEQCLFLSLPPLLPSIAAPLPLSLSLPLPPPFPCCLCPSIPLSLPPLHTVSPSTHLNRFRPLSLYSSDFP